MHGTLDMNPYHYNAKIIKVYDADTVTAIVDCGFSIKLKIRVRLYGINAPEVRGAARPEGLITRNTFRFAEKKLH